MIKNSKLNKSPIQSILHENFQDSALLVRHHDQKDQQLEKEQNEADNHHNYFKASQQTSNFHLSAQYRLRIVRVFSSLTVQLSLHRISSILDIKFLNVKSFAFSKLKTAQLIKTGKQFIGKGDRLFVIRKMQLFNDKIEQLFKRNAIKALGLSFKHILFACRNTINQNHQRIAATPASGHWKADHSHKTESQWQLGQSQDRIDRNDNIKRQNKILKKKKQKIQKFKQQFYSKINQLLVSHENFLNIK